MNQTKKRLTIIKLAISMTDTETIQLQVLKLGLLQTDDKMKDILTLLSAHNYAQAQKLISDYIDSPQQTEVTQRTSQKELQLSPEKTLEEDLIERKESISTETLDDKTLSLKEKIQHAKEQALIDQFELYSVAPTEEESTSKIHNEAYDDYLEISPEPSTETISYDALLNVDAQDILPDNITLDISDNSDTNSTEEEFFNEALHILPHTQENDFFSQNEDCETTETEDKVLLKDEKEPFIEKDIHYKTIPYIDQKFKNMANQYPPVHNSDTEYPSANAWLLKISNEGYLESEIETIIKHIEQLTKENKAEAAQLLLITAGTESKYAQFRLARALFKGELLEKNIPEAFMLINRLAMNDNYPEAICDLGQFYESGTGTVKDEQKAEELYKEAMELGINRATDHYNRLHTTNNNLLSFFKK